LLAEYQLTIILLVVQEQLMLAMSY
jgi:hypothetical protein